MKSLWINKGTMWVIGCMSIISYYYYHQLTSIEDFLAVYSMPLLRYTILLIVLLLGYSSRKHQICSFLYVRYSNIFAYIEEEIKEKVLLYLCVSILMSVSLIKFYSLFGVVLFILYEVLLFLFIDVLCSILGILWKHKVYGYLSFLILYVFFDFLFDTIEIGMMSHLYTTVLVLPLCYPTSMLYCSILVLDFLFFCMYVLLVQHTDKMVSL